MVIASAMITVLIVAAMIIAVVYRSAIVVTKIIVIAVRGTVVPLSGIIRTARQNEK